MPSIIVFSVAIYIGVFCGASPNAENQGCPDLNNHANWVTIGPYIKDIQLIINRGRATVYCQTGYLAYLKMTGIVSNHFAITCKNGVWDVDTVCREKDCQDPPVLQNGYINATSTTYNSTVMYSCYPGYTMFGERSITCLDTGNWSGMLVNCVIKDCQNPPILQDGYQNATSTTYNSTVIYSCTPGYRMIGDNSITCLDTGNWSELLANCTIKDCKDPPVLWNGFRNATSTTYNSTVIYSCNPGYTMFGESFITCLDTGNWSELLVNCTIKDCQNPPVLQDGYQNATSTTYNSTVIYSCKPGYRMIGDNSITCLDTGNWSELLVNCTIKDCGTPPMLTNGHRTFVKSTVNTTIEYTCNPGYDLNGKRNVNCIETGTWSILEANCTMKDCHSPPVLKNGFVTVSTTTYNSTAVYTCSSGYDMHGPNSIAYLATGEWDKLDANCTIKGCVDLHLPEHWETIGPNIQHIKILPIPYHALVYCQPGYSAFLASHHTYSEHFQITCRDGTWKSHSVCQKIDAAHLIG
ncbi:sushi, von Willebrand factor type A, EGF and pentraxin domain-containing protein 1-like [Dreissena polymorpha]|uniref:sushi, von Willebrand factor type A, EGF and pentraxin domain-containing protein 1-like n=1 Tax=Dreissena polymorpha TaxID=45954 RepID=UPI0022642F30|nr:sushi, von Willebrand factor type A, EGF and pentraxin domain-containing protein 1-like [Dreissena polymorpha]